MRLAKHRKPHGIATLVERWKRENDIMWNDPIVQEVRKAGEELAKKSNYSLQELFQSLRNNEKTSKAKVQKRVKEKLRKTG